jgi:hypothetical protein
VTRGQKKIRDALRAVGYEPRDVRWEPIGTILEMQGPMGGWFVDDEPVGYNVAEAVEFCGRPGGYFARKASA